MPVFYPTLVGHNGVYSAVRLSRTKRGRHYGARAHEPLNGNARDGNSRNRNDCATAATLPIE